MTVLTVSAGAGDVLINTTDATIGNNFTSTQISQLPLESRNVVNLLSLQAAVTPDGPAAAVGIAAGDVNTPVDGDPVDTPGELVVVLRSHEPGDDVTLVVEHDGEPREVVVTLGSAVG